MSNVGDQEARHKNENPPNEHSKCIDESNTFTGRKEVIEQENSGKKFDVNLKEECVEEEKIAVELDAKNGSNKTGPSITKESCYLKEEKVEPANPEMELECESETVPESAGNKTLIELNGTQIIENNNTQYQNTESIDQQTFEPKVQECGKEEDEGVEPKLDDVNNFMDTESARNGAILTEEVIKETEEAQSCKSFVHEINQDNEISEKDYDGAPLTEQERKQGEVTETAVMVAVLNLDDNLEKEDIELLPETMELSERSVCKELLEKDSKEIIDEVCESPKIASMENDFDKHIIRNEINVVVISPKLVGEETSKSSQEDGKENHDKEEVINAEEGTRERIKEETNDRTNQSRLSKEDEAVKETYTEYEAYDEFKIVESRSIDNENKTIDEYATPVPISLADGEKVISESSVECETKANELKEEVEESPLDLTEHVEVTTDSTGDPKLETSKDREYKTENFENLNPKDTSDAETQPTEINEILVKPHETKKETNGDILEKQEPTIKDCETVSNAVDTTLLKCSEQIEPEKFVCGMENTERDDQSHEIEERKLMSSNMNTTLEESIFPNQEIHTIDDTSEKMSLQEENEPICLREDSEMASVDFRINNTNEVTKYSPEKLSMTSDLSSVNTCGSEDVGILKDEEASEITPQSDTSILETLKDEDLSNVGDQEDISKNVKSLNEASRCIEEGILPSSEKGMEQENPAKLFEDLKDMTKEDKIQAELETNILRHKSLASGIKETSILDEEISSDPGKQLECAFESVPGNFGNKTLCETSETEFNENEKIQYQNTESVELQILEPEVQECEKVTGETVEPKLDDEKSNALSEINDVILTEEIPMVYDKLDVKEDIADLIIQNERGITEYQSLTSGDGAYHEVEKCDPPEAQTIETIISETDGTLNETTMERLKDEKTVVDFPIHRSEENGKEEIIDIASAIVDKQEKMFGEPLSDDFSEDTSEPSSMGEGVDILKCEDTSESTLTTTLSVKQNEKSDLAPLYGDMNSEEESSSKDGVVPLKTKESNEVAMETQDNKKHVDFSILESEVSEKNIEPKIIEQEDNYSDKLNPGEDLFNVTKESTLANTIRTETFLASEEVDNLNCDETTNSMSKIPINECEDVDKESVHVEKQVPDENQVLEDVEKTSRVVFEENEINSVDDVVETLRSLPMEETNVDESEKEIEHEQPIMRHIGNIKDDNIEIEDSFEVKNAEEKGIQNEPLEEEGDTPTEDSKVQSQEVVPDINNMYSLSTEKNNELAITTEQKSQEVSNYDEVFNRENLNKDDDCPPTAQSLGEGLILDMGKKCKETSDFHCHNSGETEIEEAHETRIDGLATEGNQSKGNECIKPENLNEEIIEKRESSRDCQQKIMSEETIEDINQVDKVKVEESPIEKIEDTLRIEQIKSENEELSEEIQKVSSSRNILIHDTHEDITVKDQDLVFHERNNESLPDEAERNNFKEAAAELDLENLFDKKNSKGTEAILISEEVFPHSELALDTEDTNYNKGTTIPESEEDPNTDLSVRQATCTATVEAGHQNVEKFVVVNNKESFMEYEKLDDTSLQSSLEVKENLKLDHEITPETEITYVRESSKEEIPADDMNIKEDDKRHNLVLYKNIAVESIIEERGIINDEKEQTESKEPLVESTRETDKKPHDADTNNTISKSTDESEKPRECPDIPFPDIALLQKGSIANLSGVSETTQSIKEPEENSEFRSEKQIPEKYHNEIEDTIVATCEKDVQLTDDLEKTEIEKSKPGNSVKVESEQEAVKCDEEKRTDNVDDENISLSSLLEMSTRESTLQMHGQVSEVKETTSPNEETQTEKADALQEEEAKTDEEKCEDDEHKKNESSSDSIVIVEASKDTDAKFVQKKHHGFMSGVGSKVKHSISKVKKAITGKSSHSKSITPK